MPFPTQWQAVADLLHQSAGGYLRNVVAEIMVTCSVCRTPAPGYSRCYRCNEHLAQGLTLADRVGFLTYAVKDTQAYDVMYGYKARGLARPVDAILLTGDIADHGTEAEYQEARALVEQLEGVAPVLTCPGNHDVRGSFRKALLGQPADDAPINEVHDLPGVRIVMCDSSIPGRDEGALTDDTLVWLAAVLDRPSPTPVVIAFHHPPVTLHSPFIDAIRLRDCERLATLMQSHPEVVAVLTGHAHTAAATTFPGRPLAVAPGVASTLRLPWETDNDLDFDMPPAIAFHVIGEDLRLTTHYRVIP